MPELWKKYLSKFILMGRSGCPTNGTELGWGDSPCKPKMFNLPLLLDPPPHILAKFLPVTCIFSYTIITYFFSTFLWTRSFNTKQCPSRISPRIVHLYPRSDQKCPLLWFVLLPILGVECPPFPKPLWETLGINLKQPKSYSFPPQ